MKEIAVISGAGTGIGQALSWQLAGKYGMNVLGFGRRAQTLRITRDKFPDKIRYVVADISRATDRHALLQALGKEERVKFLVHNAAVLEPVKRLTDITLDEWREHMAINVEGPLFLTKLLLPRLDQSRVLHISSGAARHAYTGWGAYCTSKAALHMIYQVWKKEMEGRKVIFGSARPGIVDTPMQDKVRQADESVFAEKERFARMKEQGQLLKPETVADFLSYLLLETNDEQFSGKEWDIRDTEFGH